MRKCAACGSELDKEDSGVDGVLCSTGAHVVFCSRCVDKGKPSRGYSPKFGPGQCERCGEPHPGVLCDRCLADLEWYDTHHETCDACSASRLAPSCGAAGQHFVTRDGKLQPAE
jgi:hypothetical protein